MLRISALSLALVAASTAAQAQGLVTTQKISAALANELVGESVAQCAQKGYKVWAVVVDLDGVRQALLRGDGAPIHSQDNAYYKAYSIASLGLTAWRRRRPATFRRPRCPTSPTRRARSPSWRAEIPSVVSA